jgi:hypothetical protein
MGGQQKDFISDIVFFQHQDGMRLKVRRHFLQCDIQCGNSAISLARLKTSLTDLAATSYLLKVTFSNQLVSFSVS